MITNDDFGDLAKKGDLAPSAPLDVNHRGHPEVIVSDLSINAVNLEARES